MKFVNPKNDVAFKKIFGSEDKTEVLIGFLNAVLDLHGDKAIKNVRLRDPYQTPKLSLLKQPILDIYATDNRGVTFIVEMQVSNISGMKKRFTYYVAQEYANQIERGQSYPKLTPVIFVGIFDFTLFEEPEEEKTDLEAEAEGEVQAKEKKVKRKHDYLSCHQILDRETYRHELEDLAFYFIELPKFEKQPHKLNHLLDKWVYFIKHAEDLDVVPDHVQEPELQVAYQLANQFGWKKADLREYEYRGIKIQDELGALTLATEKGREEGREEGAESAKLDVARNLLSIGLSVEQIAQSTGISVERIQQLS